MNYHVPRKTQREIDHQYARILIRMSAILLVMGTIAYGCIAPGFFILVFGFDQTLVVVGLTLIGLLLLLAMIIVRAMRYSFRSLMLMVLIAAALFIVVINIGIS